MADPTSSTSVYHLELRAFPSMSRAFNLDRETLDLRFLKPFAAGELIEYDEKRWAPDKTKLRVFEGAPIDRTGVGLGRGWGEVTRHGRDVTDTVLAEIQRGAAARPEVEALKVAITETAVQPIALSDLIALAAAAHPTWRASEQLSLAEQAVWEMLHRGELELLGPAGVVASERWQEIVLSWAAWTGAGVQPVHVKALPASTA